MFQALLSWITPHAYAVVDPDVASTSASLISGVQESVVDLFTSNITAIVAIFSLMLIVGIVIKLMRRVTK